MGLLAGGAAADKSSGEEESCLLTVLSKPCNSVSLAVLIIASRACVADMSIKGGRIGEFVANGCRIVEKSGFLLLVLDGSSLDVVGMLGMIGNVVGLKRGSSGGGKPFLTAVK